MLVNIEDFKFHYSAHATNVHDGDTLTLDVDLGMGIWKKGVSVRLNRLDAPELKSGEAGTASKLYLQNLVTNKKLTVKTIKDKSEKYGRLLAEIYIEVDTKWINVNDFMLVEHAKEYDGGKR